VIHIWSTVHVLELHLVAELLRVRSRRLHVVGLLHVIRSMVSILEHERHP
jgi:hypothetical protein